MLNIAVFVSGRGSNLKAIYEKVSQDKVRICAVVTDRNDCGAVQFSVKNKIPVYIVNSVNESATVSYEKIVEQFKLIPIHLIVLAGFLKKIPDFLIEEYENRIINIHPALLPSFGGKGMYGLNVHKAVLNSSAKISGATVHFVDKIYDHGKIIDQRTVDISDLKTPEEIAARVLKIEHELLPYIVEKFSENKIIIKNDRVYLAE
jgi:formyltetrahydrofolate-dependent phosphoribosylglycinamide formyltransferase